MKRKIRAKKRKPLNLDREVVVHRGDPDEPIPVRPTLLCTVGC